MSHPPFPHLSLPTFRVPILLGVVVALVACEPATTAEAPPSDCIKTLALPLSGETLTVETVTLDTLGNPLERRRLVHSGSGDDLAISYLYDPAGRLIAERWDAHANGVQTDAVAYTYDDAARLIETRRTNGAPRVTTQTWLDAERLAMREVDRDGDGAWDERTTLTYDADGHPATRRVDRSPDDLYDVHTTYIYDGDRLTREVELYGGNTYTRTYVYDEQQREVSRREVVEGDNVVGGPLIRTFRHLYAGDRLIQAAWFDRDGAWVEGYRYHYDTESRVIAVVWDSTLDGIEENEFRWADEGVIVQHDFRYRGNPDSTRRMTYTPGCAVDAPFSQGP